MKKNMSGRKEILIVKNESREGPGLLGDVLTELRSRYKIIDLNLGEEAGDTRLYGAVVVLGGPDSANDQTLKMKKEIAMIRQVLDASVPCLGICLGLQTLVKAAGGQVVKCPVPEVGFRDPLGEFYKIQLTEAGSKDPLFEGIGRSFNVFQLHGETVIPDGGMELVAEGKQCVNQIVRVGRNAYGIQCHFELTGEMLEQWMDEDTDLAKLDKGQLLSDFKALGETYKDTGRKLFLNFLRIAGFDV